MRRQHYVCGWVWCTGRCSQAESLGRNRAAQKAAISYCCCCNPLRCNLRGSSSLFSLLTRTFSDGNRRMDVTRVILTRAINKPTFWAPCHFYRLGLAHSRIGCTRTSFSLLRFPLKKDLFIGNKNWAFCK